MPTRKKAEAKTGRPAFIYGLYDRETGELRYIGKANDPAKRLKGHMRDSVRRNYPASRWIRKHGEPEMRVLLGPCDDWRADERQMIAEARARGDRLLNVADGGDQPFCPPEVRAANGRKTVAGMRGKYPAVAEVCRRIGQNARGAELAGDHQRAARRREIMAAIRDKVRALELIGAANVLEDLFAASLLERGRSIPFEASR